MLRTLIDSGPMIAYYNANDKFHSAVATFLESFRGQFVSTVPCITEAMSLLRSNVHVQNELLKDISNGLYFLEHLVPKDFDRIAELNIKHKSVPADFADLSLIAVSERLDIGDIFTLDSDFQIYRRLRNSPFRQVFQR